MTSRAALALFAVLAAGCTNDGPVAIEELGMRIAEVSCAKTFECCTAEEIAELYGDLSEPPRTEEECRALVGGIASFGISQIMAGVAAGRVAYHEDAAGACIAAVESVGCDAYRGSPLGIDGAAECEAMFEPLVELGGACGGESECISGYCQRSGSGDGVCAALPGRDEPCTFECAEGLYCAFGGGTEPTCQPKLDDGEACNGDSDCRGGHCEGGDPMSGTPGTCATAAAGGACGG